MCVIKKKELDIQQLKFKFVKMTNKGLIAIWNSFRSLNYCCINTNYSNCPICVNKEYCLLTLTYEELLTDELITRGLLDFAINTSQKNCINKLPYSGFGIIDVKNTNEN